MRNHKIYRKVQTGARMTTEYQASFRPPSLYGAPSKPKLKEPHPPQNGTTANLTTVRSVYVSTQWIKKTPKAPHPDTKGTQTPLKENYTTIYKNDFRAWKPNLRESFRPKHTDVDRGSSSAKGKKIAAVVEAKSVKQKQEKKPFEGVTTYRSDYLPHPVQPRLVRVRDAHRTSKELLKEPNGTSATKQEHLNGADEFFRQFQIWSLETKLHGHPKDSTFQSTTHGGQTKRTKSVFSTQTNKIKELPQTIVTKQLYRAWDGPPTFTPAHHTLNCPVKTTFSKRNPQPAETKQASSRAHLKARDSTPSTSSAQKHQRPAGSGGLSAFESSTGMFWSGSLSRGMGWFLREVEAS